MVVSYQVASMDQSGTPLEFFDEIVGDYYVEVNEGVFFAQGEAMSQNIKSHVLFY